MTDIISTRPTFSPPLRHKTSATCSHRQAPSVTRPTRHSGCELADPDGLLASKESTPCIANYGTKRTTTTREDDTAAVNRNDDDNHGEALGAVAHAVPRHTRATLLPACSTSFYTNLFYLVRTQRPKQQRAASAAPRDSGQSSEPNATAGSSDQNEHRGVRKFYMMIRRKRIEDQPGIQMPATAKDDRSVNLIVRVVLKDNSRRDEKKSSETAPT